MNYYFDMETLGLNPHFKDAKVLTAQFLDDDGNLTIFKEWELGEKELLEKVQNFVCRFNYDSELIGRTYNPVFTYNGKFDFHYYISRCSYYFSMSEMEEIFKTVILGTKHCDLMQFDNGYFVSLKKLVKKHNIETLTHFKGKDVGFLYHDKRYDDIIDHATDDVIITKKLVELGYGDRYI